MTQERVYRATQGISDEQAAIVGPILEQMAEEGRSSPHDILAAAQPDTSPLHEFFEWDDDKAAYQHRLWQARHLARSYRVEIVEVTDTSRTVFSAPGLVSIQLTPTERSYKTFEQVLDNREWLEQAVADAERRIKYWRDRFKEYRHVGAFERLEPVFEAVDRIEA